MGYSIMKDMNKYPSELTGIIVREYPDCQIGEYLEKHPIKTIWEVANNWNEELSFAFCRFDDEWENELNAFLNQENFSEDKQGEIWHEIFFNYLHFEDVDFGEYSDFVKNEIQNVYYDVMDLD